MAVRYEKSDADIGKVAAVSAVVIAIVAGFFGLMWVLEGELLRADEAAQTPQNPLAASLGRTEPPLPRLQPAPHADLLAFRAKEDAVLQTYGWADKSRGVVRVPIERAMEIVAQRGLPARPGVER